VGKEVRRGNRELKSEKRLKRGQRAVGDKGLQRKQRAIEETVPRRGG
jgi:hypothetical protein